MTDDVDQAALDRAFNEGLSAAVAVVMGGAPTAVGMPFEDTVNKIRALVRPVAE